MRLLELGITYKSSAHAMFASDATYMETARDNTWMALITLLDEVKSQPVPTNAAIDSRDATALNSGEEVTPLVTVPNSIEDIEHVLPILEWPEIL